MKFRGDSHQPDKNPWINEPSGGKGSQSGVFLCLIAHPAKASEFTLSFLHKINCQEVVREGGKGEEGEESTYLSSGSARWEQ